MTKLIDYNDPILYTPTIPVDFATDDVHSIAQLMSDALNNFSGYGLSANQIGLHHRAFIITVPTGHYAIFNPKLIHIEPETDISEEGCLTFPGLIVKMERSKKVRLRYTDITGNVDTKPFEGMTARVIQHEMCHMDGKPFYTGSSRLKLDMATKKSEKLTGKQYNPAELFKLDRR